MIHNELLYVRGLSTFFLAAAIIPAPNPCGNGPTSKFVGPSLPGGEIPHRAAGAAPTPSADRLAVGALVDTTPARRVSGVPVFRLSRRVGR